MDFDDSVPDHVQTTAHGIGQEMISSNAAHHRNEHKKSDENGDSMSGDLPNIMWRSIPMDHVRIHPMFVPLPDASDVILQSLSELCLFRQDSWQWDALHQGRLTTSNLAAILGFYEAKTSSLLKIPKSLQGHSRVQIAWQHLCHNPPANWEHLRSRSLLPTLDDLVPLQNMDSQHVWNRGHNLDFPYDYTPPNSYSNSDITPSRISNQIEARMLWGSAQEATALLNVINFVGNLDPNATVKEAGMLLMEVLSEIDCLSCSDPLGNTYRDVFRRSKENALPLLGASPDGLIEYSDGSLEIIEIKCQSPYYSNNSGKSGKFYVSFTRHTNEAIPVWHIPQIMMEMLCAGVQCRSTLVVLFYADGMKFYRVHRDEWVR